MDQRNLTTVLSKCLEALEIFPPLGGKYAFHYCLIGSHTENILLGIPVEMWLERYSWWPRIHDIAAIYFNHTMKVSAAFILVFLRSSDKGSYISIHWTLPIVGEAFC